MLDFFHKIVSPKAWVRDEPMNKIVDEWFTETLKDYTITDVDDYICTLNGKEVWIANRYFGGPYFYDARNPQGFCGIKNAKKLYKIVDSILKERLLKTNKEWKEQYLVKNTSKMISNGTKDKVIQTEFNSAISFND